MVSTSYRTEGMEYRKKKKIRHKNSVFTRVKSGTLRKLLNKMYIICYDYRYNNDESGIELHICQSYLF